MHNVHFVAYYVVPVLAIVTYFLLVEPLSPQVFLANSIRVFHRPVKNQKTLTSSAHFS